MLALILTLALFSGSAIPHETELKETVSAYRSLLAKNDKFGALKYILDGCQNEFISRREPIILSWDYLEASPVSENEARVKIAIEAMAPGAKAPMKFETIETWVWTGESWKLRVEKLNGAGVMKALTSSPVKPSTLKVTPPILKIKFFNTHQIGAVTIVNGTEQPVKVLGVTVDEKRFEVTSRPDSVAPGAVAYIRVRYKETENAKNQKSQLSLRLEEAGAERLFDVPIIYNYVSKADLAVWGLTEEKAEPITHQDKKKFKPLLGKLTPEQIKQKEKQPSPTAQP